jgi:steroid 5-alpha reductase family enzyme
MKMSDKRTMIVLAIVAVIAVYLTLKGTEKYRPVGADYRYNTVDTNPMRRTAGFFDNCSPENMEDCERNNPYEGLPLP